MAAVIGSSTNANHPLTFISKYASYCKSNGGFIVEPPCKDNLYGLIHMEYESKTDFETNEINDGTEGTEGTDEIEGGEGNDNSSKHTKDYLETSEDIDSKKNQRFYIDETNMVERRFLPDDTSKFNEKRDIDPFSLAMLYDTILDSLWECLELEKDIKAITQMMFLNGIKNKDQSNEKSLILQIARKEWQKHSIECVRASSRWNWKETSSSPTSVEKESKGLEENHAMTLLWEYISEKSKIYDTIGMVGIIWNLPIILEKRNSNQWIEFGARPGNNNTKVIWIREVPDGYLGINSTAGIVREYTRRLKMTGHVYSNDTFICKEKLPYKVPTIAELQEILKNNSVEYSKKDKKPELTRRLEENLLWEIY
jgi:hypothetical protein